MFVGNGDTMEISTIIYIIIIIYIYIYPSYIQFFKDHIPTLCPHNTLGIMALQVHPLAAALLARSRGGGLRLVAKFGSLVAGSDLGG